MKASESDRRHFYEQFAKNMWTPHEVAAFPLPQLVRIWLWKDADFGPVVSRAEAVEFLRKQEERKRSAMGLLAEWIVAIKTQGGKEAAAQVDAAGKALEKGEAKAGGFMAKLGGLIKNLGIAGLAIGAIKSLLSETEEGQRLTEAFSKIADILAQAVAPLVTLVASVLEKMAPILEKIAGILQPIFSVIGSIIGAVTDFVTGVLDTILGTITDILEFLGFEVAKVEGTAKKKEEQKKGGGFEEATNVFKRIQEAAVGGDFAQKQYGVMVEMLVWIKKQHDLEKSKQPAVA